MGSQETRFDLHSGLLSASSDFFKTMITGDFKERAQNEIKLPEQDVKINFNQRAQNMIKSPEQDVKISFKESTQNVIRLPEQDVKIFRFFVQWLYTRRLRGFYYPETLKPTIEELKEAAIAELENQKLNVLEDLDPENPSSQALYLANYRDAPFSHLVGLYILADTFQVRDLKDPIITLIMDVYCFYYSGVAGVEDGAQETQEEGQDADEAGSALSNSGREAETYTTLFWNLAAPPGLEDPCKGINMAWEALPRNSPLCQLTVECFCDNVVLVEEHTNGRQYHPGFLAAIAQSYALRLGRVDKTYSVPNWDQEGQRCKFHEHGAGSECPFAKRNILARTCTDRSKERKWLPAVC